MVTIYHLPPNAQYLGTTDEEQYGNCLTYLQKLQFLESIYYIFIAVNTNILISPFIKLSCVLQLEFLRATYGSRITCCCYCFNIRAFFIGILALVCGDVNAVFSSNFSS